jgi:hypothetical protein
MKKTPDKKMCVLALAFILIFGIANTHAGVVTSGSFDMLLIGTVISPDEKGNSKTYELRHQEDKWRFKVTKARVSSGAGVTGWRILSDIFPRIITLFADERILAPLKQPEIIGKNFKLTGSLYVSSKTFHLNFVEEVIEE